MRVVISVVSHGHFELIKELGCIEKLVKSFDVYLMDNVNQIGFREWCEQKGVKYFSNKVQLGFGENNNILFQAAYNSAFDKDSWFLVLNPDVIANVDIILELILRMKNDGVCLAAINLFRDAGFTKYDNSVRRFPSLTDFLKSYLLGYNPSIIDKAQIHHPVDVDWASGSFLMFNSDLYSQMGGFDIKYFMYCEDIDICLRARLIAKQKVMFYPSIKAVHLAAHSNRKLFSKSFLWHIRSIVRYLLVKRTLNR